MSANLKLLFDECVGRPVLQAISGSLSIVGPPPEFNHVLNFQEQGVYDEIWIPQIANDGWIVVTADRGTTGGRKKGEKLPILCKRFSVTHIMLSAAVHRKGSLDKIRFFLEVWPDIATLASVPRGSGYSLRLTTSERAQLVQVYQPPPPPP